MLIKLGDIEDAGLDLGYEETPQELGLVYPNTRFEGSIAIKVRLSRLKETVTASGKVQTVVDLECGRCTKPFCYRVKLPIKTTFSPMPAGARASKENNDYELSTEELGLCFYSGELIDLGEFVREQILLAIPMVPLCSIECRGLCHICGQDRNVKECGCIKEEEYGSSKA